jgi:2,3-bisphosphoglycerate-independent phosphoglycerate mutase
MVGHTGNLSAAIKAIEALDTCLGKVEDALISAGGEMLITADHGNVEQMHDDGSGQPHTAHTMNPVPLLYIGRPATVAQAEHGSLTDVSPTLLTLMGLPIPGEMTGRPLFVIKNV